MKLASINESYIISKIREAMSSSDYFNKPLIQTDKQYEATSGHNNPQDDEIATQPVGIPSKPRHRQYLGMERRPGTIRL
jgi:hypothetical protein